MVVVALVVAIVCLALMAEKVQHLSILVNRGVSASSAQHLEQYKKGVGRWRHSQEALYLENGSAKDLYPVYSVGRILLELYSQPMLLWDKISTLRDFVGSLRPCTSTGENCPARYLENGSAKQLYPQNNIGSTARALYSQPKLFCEVFGPFSKKLLVNC